MPSLVRLSKPGALLFFISFRVSLYVGLSMCLGWHSFVRAVGLGVKNCLVLCKKKKCTDLQYFISVCLCLIFFIFHFPHLFLWSSFVYLVWSSIILKQFQHDLFVFFRDLLSVLPVQSFVQFCIFYFLSISLSVWPVFHLSQFFPSVF